MNGDLGPTFDHRTAESARWLIQRALNEDLDDRFDITSEGLVPLEANAAAQFVSRASGVVCGLPVCGIIVNEFSQGLELNVEQDDGSRVEPGSRFATLIGNARELLKIERTCLNFLGRLSGVATLTADFVAAVAGTGAKILDTRKTTPGWRLLEKYAVRCGGGHNHRLGLYDGVLIKDNHLAICEHLANDRVSASQAVSRIRAWMLRHPELKVSGNSIPIEVEVDCLRQLEAVALDRPNVVLLDNMTTEQISECVRFRDANAREIQLEASGGVRSDNVAEIARTGVDRISVGALTHSAVNFDIGLDWIPNP